MRKVLLLFSVLAACSSAPSAVPATPAGGSADATGVDGAGQDSASAEAGTGTDALAAKDAPAGDGAAPVDAMPLDGSGSDGGLADASPDAAPDATEDTAPDNGLDPDLGPDTGPPDTGPAKGLGTLFAHTPSVLYRLDQAGFVQVGPFQFDKNGGQVTDIALDEDANLFAITFFDLFGCNSKSAQCQWLASLPQQFNGLTFVPEGVLGPKAELVGIANSGTWNHLQIKGNTATIAPLGSYGGGFQSSGDAFSVEGVGTLATVTSGPFGGDKLAIVDPKTGTIKKVLGDTGVNGLWGLAWHADKIYGFSSNGQIVTLDPATGKATTASGLNAPGGVSWWGAGVSTRAAQGN